MDRLSPVRPPRRSGSLLAVLVAAWIPANPIFAQSDTSLAGLLPRPSEPGAWQQQDSARLYPGEELYQLIDGGADLYLEYGFRDALAAAYAGPGDRVVKLEIYRMKDDGAAFGVFSVVAGGKGERWRVGDEGRRFEDFALFRKGPFVVFLSSVDTSDETKREIEALAGRIDAEIPERGKKPALMALLPDQAPVSDAYARGPLGLSAISSLIAGEMFGTCEAAAGTYTDHTILLLSYPTGEQASGQFANLSRELERRPRYSHINVHGGILSCRERGGTRLRFMRQGEMLVILAMRGSCDAEALTEKVLVHLRRLR